MLEEALKTGSLYGDAEAPVMPTGSIVPEATSLFDNTLMPEDALTSLRMKGSVIHREIMRVKVSELTAPPPPPPPFEMAPVAAPVLRLAEAVPPPQLGTAALPSIGSLLHHKRECKPCTFFHTRGCENKEDCQFCHLCGPGEKKKRLKALKREQREANFVALENAKAALASYRVAEEQGLQVNTII